MSTDKRGISRTNRLIAVPPLSAKQRSLATIGSTATSSRTCAKFGLSGLIIEVGRQRDEIFRMQLPAWRQHALALAKIHLGQLKMRQPLMLMPLGQRQEKPLHLHARTSHKKRHHPSRTYVHYSLHQHVSLIDRFPRRN